MTTIGRAFAVMRELRCQHLPVVAAGTVIGLVSVRDLLRAETRPGADIATDEVREAMSGRFLTTGPGALAREVARRMATGEHEAAIVVERGAVIGIFTITDALRFRNAFPT
jgi:acetoin utilization protein AcuB